MEEFLVGVCGKTEREAMYVSFREARMLQEGYDRRMRIHWEVARWEQFMQVSISPNIRRNSKPHTPQAMLRFPWEMEFKEEVPAPFSQEQKQALSDIRSMFYNR